MNVVKMVLSGLVALAILAGCDQPYGAMPMPDGAVQPIEGLGADVTSTGM